MFNGALDIALVKWKECRDMFTSTQVRNLVINGTDLSAVFGSDAIKQKVYNILSGGALRKGHDGVLVAIAKSWEMCIEEDVVVEMLTVLESAGERVMAGRTSRVDSAATLLMASLRGNKSILSGADAIRVLEVFGICFKCGGMVMNAIKNCYATPKMRGTLEKIVFHYQEMSRYRKIYGDGTDAETQYTMRLFGLA